MKKIENNFVVTGFVGKDAEIRQFTTASVARFPLAIARQEKSGDDTNRVSALMNMEAWRKNENAGSFDQLTKGTLLTVEGYFKPEEWADQGETQPHRDGRCQVLSGCRERGSSCGTEKGQEVNSALSRAERSPDRFCFARYRSTESQLLYTPSILRLPAAVH